MQGEIGTLPLGTPKDIATLVCECAERSQSYRPEEREKHLRMSSTDDSLLFQSAKVGVPHRHCRKKVEC